MTTDNNLFSEFPAVSKEQWIAKAIEDLRGADFDEKLVWKTAEGFNVQPFYTIEDLESRTGIASQQQIIAAKKPGWISYAEIMVSDNSMANRKALDLVKQGATGLLFHIEDASNWSPEILLEGIHPSEIHISFTSPEPTPQLIRDYISYLEKKGIDKEKVHGFYNADILESWMNKGIEPDYSVITEIIQLTQSLPNFRGLVVQSDAFVNTGASKKQELAFTLNKLAEYFHRLTDAGSAADDIARNIHIQLAAGGDYFMEIAGIRAMRIMLNRFLELYHCAQVPVEIMVSGSKWSKTLYDPYLNMLRNTTETMSAILGGADAVLTRPHDYYQDEQSGFSQRIALNISTILKEESYFDKVADPAAGSYYLESLTQELGNAALQLFKDMEAAGGFEQAFRAGKIQREIEPVRKKKESDNAQYKKVYMGT